MAKKRKTDYLSILDNPWSDEDIAAHASYVEERRNRPAAPPSFSDVEAGFSTTETMPEELNILERLLAARQSTQESGIAGGERTLGSLGFANAEGAFTGPLPQALQQTMLNSLFGDGTWEQSREDARQTFGDMVTSGSQRAQNADRLLEAADLPTPVEKIARGANDVIGSPSSLGSIPGGAFAAIPAADVYAQEYTAAIRAGVNPEEADTYAKSKAVTEFGISAVPAGRLFKWGDDFFRGATANTVRGTIRTAAGEGVEEGVTEAAHMGLDTLFANQANDKALRDFAAGQAPKTPNEIWERLERSTIAGMMGGAGLGGPMVAMQDAARAGQLAADLNAKSKSYLDLIEPKTAPAKPRVRVPTPAVPMATPQLDSNVKKPVKKDADFLEELAAGLKQEQIAMPGPEGETARSVINKITSDMSNGQHRQLASRLLRGDVVLVNSDRSIPAGAEARGTAGFYDGKRTYLVAPRFNKDQPITGQIMDTLAHETTHAGDVSGFASNKLVGEENNAKLQKLIMDTARKQYGSDDFINIEPTSPEFKNLTPEQKATIFAIQNTDSSGAAALETTAYYVNFAREAARDKRARKATAAVWQNVKSAVKDKFGMDASLDDVAYLSDKLLRQAAETAPMQGDVNAAIENYGGGETNADGLAMFISGGRGEGAAVTEGRSYLSADGKRKYEIADNDSRLTLPTDIRPGMSFKLGDILKHDKLYNEMPELRDVPVEIAPIDAKYNGLYYPGPDGDPTKGRLVLPMNEIIEEVRSGGLKPFGPTHLTVLHETQHAAQNKAGSTGGASLEGNMSPVGRDVKRSLESLLRQKEKDKAEGRKESPYLNSLIAKKQEELKVHETEAEQRYMDNLGELEARMTESRVRLSPETRAMMTDNMRTIEDGYRAQGKTLRGDGGRPLVQPSRVAPGTRQQNKEVERVAAKKSGLAQSANLNDNFRQWFGNSIAVNEDGSPKTMYTGTSKDKDFTSFSIPKNGAWFTDDPAGASQYAIENDSMTATYEPGKGFVSKNTASRVFPVYLKIENPYYPTDSELEEYRTASNYKKFQGQWFDKLRAQGYDAVVFGTEADPESLNTVAIIGDATQIKSVNNSGDWSNKKKDVLRQSADAVGFDSTNIDTSDRSKLEGVTRVLERFFTPGGFLDRDLLEALQHSKGDLAAMATDNLFYANKLREAVDDVVKKSKGKYTDESIRELIAKRLATIDAEEDSDTRQSMMAALDRELPGVGKAFELLRLYKLQMTRELIAERRNEILKGGNKMTAKERNIYKKMARNAERYTTRAYLATYDKDIGFAYGKRMVEAFKKDPKSKEGKVVADAIDYLVKNEVVIPDADTLAKFTTEKIRRMYETWVGSSKGLKGEKGKAKMIKALAVIPDKTNGELNQKAWEIVQEMLGVTEKKGQIANKYTPSMRQNRTILEARSDLPESLRKLLGEITDPLLREAITMNRMTNLVSKTRFLMELFEEGQGKWWSPTKTGKFQTKLTAAGYGPLRDTYVSKDVEDAITGTVAAMTSVDEAMSEVVQNGDAVMKLMAGATLPVMKSIMSAQKTNGVVFDIYNAGVNLVGAVGLMAPLNGLGPINAGKGMAGAAKVLALDVWDRKLGPEARDVVKELLTAGVTDSATMGDLKGHAFDGVRKELAKLGAKDQLSLGKVATAVWKGATGQHKLGQALRTAYAFMDVWTKAATYYDRKDLWTKMNQYEKLELTEEQIVRKAGFEAAGTNVSYERALPIVKTLERNLPFFMFLTYKSETARVLIMSYLQAARDFKMAANAKTAKGKALAGAYGMKRLAGTAAVSSVVIGATMKALDDEDEDDKKKRFLDADWMKSKILVPLGMDKEGREVLLDLNRVDPIGPIHEAIIAMADAPEDQKWEAAGKAVTDFIFAKSTGVQAIGQMIWDASVAAAATVDPSLKKYDLYTKKTITENDQKAIYDWLEAAPGDVGVNFANVVERLFMPGSLKPIYGTKGEVVEGALGKTLHNMGANLYVRDPDMSLGMRARDHKDVVTALKKERDSAVKSGNLDPEKMNELIREEMQSWQEVANGYEGYMAFDGAKHAGAEEVIGDKKLANQARTGRFKSTLIDQKNLNDWYKKELKKKGADRQEVTETYRELKKLYSEVSTNGNSD